MFLFNTAKYFERFLLKGCHMGAETVIKLTLKTRKSSDGPKQSIARFNSIPSLIAKRGK